jgi:hypothetical protein
MPRAFARREAHRTALNAHFVILLVGLGIAFAVNRFVTPETFWAHWVGLVWGAAFAIHLAIFARGTIATMGRPRDPSGK